MLTSNDLLPRSGCRLSSCRLPPRGSSHYRRRNYHPILLSPVGRHPSAKVRKWLTPKISDVHWSKFLDCYWYLLRTAWSSGEVLETGVPKFRSLLQHVTWKFVDLVSIGPTPHVIYWIRVNSPGKFRQTIGSRQSVVHFPVLRSNASHQCSNDVLAPLPTPEVRQACATAATLDLPRAVRECNVVAIRQVLPSRRSSNLVADPTILAMMS